MTFNKTGLIADKLFIFAAAICFITIISASPSADAAAKRNVDFSGQAGKEINSLLSGLPEVDPHPLPDSATGTIRSQPDHST
jgi:hypothetical protein